MIVIAMSIMIPAVFAASSDAHRVSNLSSVAGNWLTYGATNSRNGVQSMGSPATPVHVAWTSSAQRGAIYGEPLIDGPRVFIATEANVVEALSSSTGRVLWSRSIGTPVPAGDLPCGDITPTVGVTSTMVIDPTTGRLFASAETLIGSAVHHVLVALSLSHGTILFQRDIDQPGWTSTAELQRGALGIDQGQVILGFGGNYGDCSSYVGYVMAVPVSGSGRTLVYRTPTANGDAIWGPAGMAISPSGAIYVSTGNGASRGNFDMSNAVIKLSSALKLRSWFAPSDWVNDNVNDYDLSSTAPILLPHKLLFAVGKEQTGFLIHAGRLGGIGHQLQAITVCNARGSDAYSTGFLILPCPFTGMVALRLIGGQLRAAWHSTTALGSPSIGGGVVWSVSGGTLLGLARATGAVVDQIAAPVTEHFAAPSIGDGLIIVGGASQVTAYTG